MRHIYYAFLFFPNLNLKIALSYNIKNWTRKKFDSRVEENTIQDAKNIRPINTNNKYTYINNKANKNSNRYFGRNYSPEFLEGLYANL